VNTRILAIAAALCAARLQAQSVTSLPEVSPAASVSQVVGISSVKVVYHRPSVNKRRIWGDLVPYGFTNQGFGTSKAAPWRAGANENTLVTFQDDVSVAGKALKAGTYGLSMALAPDGGVTVIFSTDTTAWGSFFYDPSADALRATTRMEDAPYTEQLRYQFDNVTANSADLALYWESKRIPVPLRFDTDRIVEDRLKEELHGSRGFVYQAWVEGSQYLLDHDRDLPLALTWADTSVSAPFIGERNFATLSNKSLILEKLGRKAEADQVMDGAIKIGSPTDIHAYARHLLQIGDRDRAVATFKLNARLHPGAWPVDYGLARAYSAMGDYKGATEALLRAQQALPEGDVANAAAIKINLEKLRKGEDIN
jgi:tetratricopeptide (TPR) repeat protein